MLLLRRGAMARVHHAACAATAAAAAAKSHSPAQAGLSRSSGSGGDCEEQDVPGIGRFSAMADGRVRIAFADRTLLYLSADRRLARLVLSDGVAVEVPTSRPIGVESYVQVRRICCQIYFNLSFAIWEIL